jgi:acetate kinase
MDDYALVLNAGSSSLKFCVYRRTDETDWEVAGRGQIEGIGTAPRLSAKDAHGVVLANNSLGAAVRDGHAAIDALAVWLRSKWHGAQVLGTALFTAECYTGNQW